MQKRTLVEAIPRLRAVLESARDYFRGVTLLPSNPLFVDDTWESPYWDNYYHAKASFRVESALRGYDEAIHKLDLLEYSSDPVTLVASDVLKVAHGHLKRIGLSDKASRQASAPSHRSGQAVAEVIWQGRNQDQHWVDGGLRKPCVTCFRILIASSPILFGLERAPTGDEEVNSFLLKQSWAPEILRILGWTTTKSAVSGLEEIRPTVAI
jgi:hypothetical protein